LNETDAGAMSPLPPPGPDNGYLDGHIALLRRSLRVLTGRDLLDGDPMPQDAAERIYFAPFALLSHDASPDPLLTYANACALALFELSWEELVRMPSRLTAEPGDRGERARFLARAEAHGYIDDYAGVRISRNGRRFAIEGVTLWNLTDAQGRYRGQAAAFSVWRHL
jgi:hypothetical protein